MLEDLFAHPSKDSLLNLVWVYLVGLGVLVTQQWSSRRAVGLPLAYALSFSMLHLVGAAVYSIPGYYPRSAILLQNHSSLQNTFEGFRVACFGFWALVLGVILTPLVARPRQPAPMIRHPNVTSRMPVNLILMGVLFFFVIFPVVGKLPSLGGLSIAGTMLTGIGVYLRCRQSWQARNWREFSVSLLMTLCFPVVTILFLGFASYGSAMAMTILVLVTCFVRPRWVSVATLLGMVFVGLSFYINWMVWRVEIREAVWGSYSFESRVERLAQMVTNVRVLDVGNQNHLEIMDLRLNQNDLVGKGVIRLRSGRVDYGEGYSLWVAATSWVPRLLWPNKPLSGGSGNFVSVYTGQEFAEGTSVGAGQPLEFYANFGMNGVLVCFFLLGLAIGWFDCRASDCLNQGDWWSACRWLLPGMAFLNPGGMMNEAVSSAAASMLLLLAIHHALFSSYYPRHPMAMRPRHAPMVRGEPRS